MFGFIKQFKEDREMQKVLTDLFSGRSKIRFMSLDSTIHNVILREAIASGDPEPAVEKFLTTAEIYQGLGSTDDQRAELMLQHYRQLDTATP